MLVTFFLFLNGTLLLENSFVHLQQLLFAVVITGILAYPRQYGVYGNKSLSSATVSKTEALWQSGEVV